MLLGGSSRPPRRTHYSRRIRLTQTQHTFFNLQWDGGIYTSRRVCVAAAAGRFSSSEEFMKNREVCSAVFRWNYDICNTVSQQTNSSEVETSFHDAIRSNTRSCCCRGRSKLQTFDSSKNKTSTYIWFYEDEPAVPEQKCQSEGGYLRSTVYMIPFQSRYVF